VHCVGLPTVLSRVRLQPSFGLPIAPQDIPSWILLLHVRSHPTGRRHLIVVVRPSCAPWFVSITPTSSCISRARCRDPVGTLRLNQARRGLCTAETDAISIRNCFVSWFCWVPFFTYQGGLFPGAILVAVAVGRFADNRSPPTSRWAHAATIPFDSPGPRLWRGPRWRAIGGRGAKCEREPPLALFFEPESERAEH